jgi:integrase
MGDVVKRKGNDGKPRYYVRYVDVDGVRRMKLSKQRTKEEAKAFLATVEARVRNGQVGIHEVTEEERARRTITVAALARLFLGEVEDKPGYAPPKIKSLKNYRDDARKNINRLPARFSARPAASIKNLDVEHLRDELTARKLAGASVVQVLATLSKLYSWGNKVGLIEGGNPVQGVERPRTSSSIDYLDATEVGRLLLRAETEGKSDGATREAQTCWPMVATAIFAGLRKGELLGLRWTDVALDAGRIDVLRSYQLLPKSGKPRHVPINPELARILRWWRDLNGRPIHEGLVFPVEGERGHLRMGTVEDTLGITELLTRAECHVPADGHPWHMLRHTFASHFVMRGGSLLALQRLLGHSTPTMAMKYAHLAPDHLAGEVARMVFSAPAPTGVTSLDDVRRQRASDGE